MGMFFTHFTSSDINFMDFGLNNCPSHPSKSNPADMYYVELQAPLSKEIIVTMLPKACFSLYASKQYMNVV